MAHKTGTAEELQAEIARRIAANPACNGCLAPMPVPANKALYLANWTVVYEPGRSEALVAIVLGVMREFDLI